MLQQCNRTIPLAVLAIAVVSAFIFMPLTVVFAGDFTQWIAVTSDTRNDLNWVWGSSGSDIFTVGSGGTIIHYDGKTWVPMNSGVKSDLHGVWGSSGTNVFVVGEKGAITRYDGKVWGLMTSGTTSDLYSVWGSSGADVFAVGSAGVIVHYDGKAWTPMTSSVIDDLYCVWGSSSTNVYAAGDSGIIVRYDGKVWVQISNVTMDDLFGIWGSSGADVFAVGRAGTIVHYDGKVWTQMSNNTPDDLFSVWGSSSTDVFAVGRAGAILRYNAESWEPMTSRTRGNLYGVWGSSSLNVFAVGLSGTIVRFIPPVVTTVSPIQGSQGETLNITVTGKNLSGASEVGFGAGIAVNSFRVSASDQILASISIVPGAVTGARDVSVTTPSGVSTLAGSFSVKQAIPVVASVAPNQANQETSLNVVVAGANFTGATQVSFGTGIVINNFAVISPNQIMANITITTGTVTGVRTISVTTPGGTSSLPDSFTVKQALPVITSVSPAQGTRGATLNVTIYGKNFDGTSDVRFGSGVAVNRFTVSGPNEIIVNLTIIASATEGTREVSVTTPGGISLLSGGFTVKQGLPVITSVSPGEGSPGDTLDVIINGSYLDGVTSVNFSGDVAVNSFSNRSPIQIAARIIIARNATAGAKDVLVTTAGGAAVLTGGFTVKEGPLGTIFIALVWVGIAVVVLILVLVLRTLRRRRAASL